MGSTATPRVNVMRPTTTNPTGLNSTGSKMPPVCRAKNPTREPAERKPWPKPKVVKALTRYVWATSAYITQRHISSMK